MTGVSVDMVEPRAVETEAERRGSFLCARNVLTSVRRTSLTGRKSYSVSVRMEIVSRGLFVTRISTTPNGNGHQPVAECVALGAARGCPEEPARGYPAFDFDAAR